MGASARAGDWREGYGADVADGVWAGKGEGERACAREERGWRGEEEGEEQELRVGGGETGGV